MRGASIGGRALLLGLSLVVATCAATTRVAHAASADETNAIALFETGRKLYEKKDYAGALVAFEGALKLAPSPNIRLYMGRCYRELHKLASAHTAFGRAASEAHDLIATRHEVRYRATEEAALKEGKALEGKIPHLTIAVPTVPKGLHVRLDDAEVPAASFGTSLEVDAGSHSVAAVAPRFELFTQTVTARDGGSVQVQVTLTAKAVATIQLKVMDKPAGLSVRVDDQAIEGTALEQPIEVAPGAHTVTATAPGREDFSWTHELVDGATMEVPVALIASDGGVPRWLLYTAGGATVLTLGFATGLAIDAKSTSDSEQAKPIGERTADARDHVKTLSTQANVLFIAGGAFAVGTGVLAWITFHKSTPKVEGTMPPAESTAPSATVMPWAGPGGFGLAAVGRF